MTRFFALFCGLIGLIGWLGTSCQSETSFENHSEIQPRDHELLLFQLSEDSLQLVVARRNDTLEVRQKIPGSQEDTVFTTNSSGWVPQRAHRAGIVLQEDQCDLANSRFSTVVKTGNKVLAIAIPLEFKGGNQTFKVVFGGPLSLRSFKKVPSDFLLWKPNKREFMIHSNPQTDPGDDTRYFREIFYLNMGTPSQAPAISYTGRIYEGEIPAQAFWPSDSATYMKLLQEICLRPM